MDRMNAMGKPRRVIIAVTDLFLPNGLVTASRNLADALTASGYEVEFFVQHSASEPFTNDYKIFYMNPFAKITHRMRSFKDSKSGLKPLRRTIGFFLEPLVKYRVRRRLAGFERDEQVIIGASAEAYNFLASLLNITEYKNILQIHMSFEGLTPYDKQNIDEATEKACFLTALSEEDTRRIAQRFAVQCFYTPNIIDMGQVDNPYKPGSSRVVYAGRLSVTKQVEHLVGAFQALNNPDWSLHIYGDGPTVEAVRDASKSANNIFMHGTIEGIAEAFTDAAINVLSSRIEGLPMTIIEAGQMGVPTVAYAVSAGVKQGVGSGGILVEPQDQAGLEQALGKLMNDTELRQQMSKSAYTQSQEYKPETVVARWEEIFKKL